ncbi:hypothetical protein QVL82_00570 [Cellulosimicrobium funkei]
MRPLHASRIDGLVLKGRALPISSAGGVEVFDAGKLFLTENQLPVAAQSTTSLLLNLASTLRPSMLDRHAPDTGAAMEQIGELAKRGAPVDAVIRSTIASEMAEALSYRVAIPYLVEANAFPVYASSDLLERASKADDPWRQVLTAYADSFSSADELQAYVSAEFRRAPRKFRALRHLTFPNADVPDVPTVALSNPVLSLALSGAFTSRVEEWLTGLLEEDLQAFVACSPPPPSVFMALRPINGPRDEVGQWFWERFTASDVGDWATSTLLLEWRAGRGESVGGCAPRLLAERRVDHARVADLALERAASRHGRRRHSHGLSPDAFVSAAVQKLESNQPAEAADIFRALIELRPGDGEAWNNYGFCLMSIDYSRGLLALQRASLYELTDPWLNLGNRTMAFHMLGDDASALEALAEIHLPDGSQSREVYSWHHNGDGSLELVSQTLLEYVSYLHEHLKTCGEDMP